MKRLPCGCKDGAWATLDEPLIVGTLHSRIYTYKCAKCKKIQRLARDDFKRLPDLTPQEVKDLGFHKEFHGIE